MEYEQLIATMAVDCRILSQYDGYLDRLLSMECNIIILSSIDHTSE